MLVNFQMFSQKRENNWELFVINKTLQVLDKTIWKYPSFSYFLRKMKSIFPLLETKKNNVISLSQVPVMKIDTGHLSTLQKLYEGISEIFTTFFEKLQWSQKNWMRYFFTLQRGGTRYCIQRYYLGVSVDECDNIFTHIDFQS